MNKQATLRALTEVLAHKAIIARLTAGDPDLETTARAILAAQEAGVALIALGIPFSDPVVDEDAVQRAGLRALEGGTTVAGIFDMLEGLKARLRVPLLFDTYANPLFVYGYARFFARCAELGVYGVLVPDLPFEERDEAAEAARESGVCMITMVAPAPEERLQKLLDAAEGFVYVAASPEGVAGILDRARRAADAACVDAAAGAAEDVDAGEGVGLAGFVALLRRYTALPIVIGGGVETPELAAAVLGVADGVLVGNAIARRMEAARVDGDGVCLERDVRAVVAEMVGGAA